MSLTLHLSLAQCWIVPKLNYTPDSPTSNFPAASLRVISAEMKYNPDSRTVTVPLEASMFWYLSKAVNVINWLRKLCIYGEIDACVHTCLNAQAEVRPLLLLIHPYQQLYQMLYLQQFLN